MLSLIYYFKISNLSLKPNIKLKILNINIKENDIVKENENLFSCLVIEENKILNILAPLKVKIKKIHFKEQEIIFDYTKIFLVAEPIKENLLSNILLENKNKSIKKDIPIKVEKNIEDKLVSNIKDKVEEQNIEDKTVEPKVENIKVDDSNKQNFIKDISHTNNIIDKKDNIETLENTFYNINKKQINNFLKEENINKKSKLSHKFDKMFELNDNKNILIAKNNKFKNIKSKNLHSQLNFLSKQKDIEVKDYSANKDDDSSGKNKFFENNDTNYHKNILHDFKVNNDQNIEELKKKKKKNIIEKKFKEKNINKDISKNYNKLENPFLQVNKKKNVNNEIENLEKKKDFKSIENNFEIKKKKDTIKNLNNKLNKSSNIKDKIFSKLYKNVNASKVINELKPLTPEEIIEAKKNSITNQNQLLIDNESNFNDEVNKNFFSHLDEVNKKYLNNKSSPIEEEEKRNVWFEKLNKYSSYNFNNTTPLNENEDLQNIEKDNNNVFKKKIAEKERNNLWQDQKQNKEMVEKERNNLWQDQKQNKEMVEKERNNLWQDQKQNKEMEEKDRNNFWKDQKLNKEIVKKEKFDFNQKQNQLYNLNKKQDYIKDFQTNDYINNFKKKINKDNKKFIYNNPSCEVSNLNKKNKFNNINLNTPIIYTDLVQKNLKNWLFKKDGKYVVSQKIKSYIFSVEINILNNFLKHSQITFYDYIIFLTSFLLKKFKSLNFVNKGYINEHKKPSYSIKDRNIQNINLVYYNDCKKTNYIISNCEEIKSLKNLHEKLYFFNKSFFITISTFQITSLLMFDNWTSIINKIIYSPNTNLLIYNDILDKNNKVYTFNLLYDIVETNVNENEVILFMNYLKYYLLDPKKFFTKLFL